MEKSTEVDFVFVAGDFSWRRMRMSGANSMTIREIKGIFMHVFFPTPVEPVETGVGTVEWFYQKELRPD